MKEALVVFAKLPVPGQVKTRLTSVLDEAEAARLYEAFLRDALDGYVRLGPAVRLYLSPPADPVPAGLVPETASVHLQRGEGLGARMLQAFVETFAAGYERIVLIGTDHPTLPPAFIRLAFEALAAPFSASIGPTEDGGYYLLGANELYPQLFHDIVYSTPRVFAETLDRVEQTGAALTVLPTWYDVDTPEALGRLVQDLRAEPEVAPHTRQAVRTLLARHPGLAEGA